MNRLTMRLDPRLDAIAVFADLTNAETKEFELLDAVIAELESNMSLAGTTAGEMARREAWFGITPDESKSLEARRSVLIARLRGQGTTTPELVKNVAISFDYGAVEVNETDEDYTVNIIFTDILGIPADIEDFKRAIEDAAPAHLVLKYTYKHNTWDMLEAFGLSWDEWNALGLTFDEMTDYSPTNSLTL